MDLTLISDTHNQHNKIKYFKQYDNPVGGDIIIHCGDATVQGTESEVKDFLKWFGELDYSHRIFTPGNHDWLFEQNPTLARQMCKDAGVTLLLHESAIINGINFFGSPWTPFFHNWAFNAGTTVTEAAFFKKPYIGDLWKDIPSDTEVLITHGPPYDILDELTYVNGDPKGQFVGCPELRKVVDRIKPQIHAFGHIHCGYGEKHLNGISFYNVSICDSIYYPSNDVKVINL